MMDPFMTVSTDFARHSKCGGCPCESCEQASPKLWGPESQESVARSIGMFENL